MPCQMQFTLTVVLHRAQTSVLYYLIYILNRVYTHLDHYKDLISSISPKVLFGEHEIKRIRDTTVLGLKIDAQLN